MPDLLGLDIVAGTGPATLEDPTALLLNAHTANTLFGRTDIVGESLVLNEDEVFTVGGVFADVPERTHLRVDVVASLQVLERWFGMNVDDIWDSPNYLTYVRLAPGVSAAAFEEKTRTLLEDRSNGRTPDGAELRYQPVRDIHLHSSLVSELDPQGSLETVFLLSGIALLILLGIFESARLLMIRHLLDNAARAGARVASVGIFHGRSQIDLNRIVEGEIDWLGCASFRTELAEVLPLLPGLQGELRLLASTPIRLDAVPQAYRALIDGAVPAVKTILVPDGHG